jgi:hypothetical protein
VTEQTGWNASVAIAALTGNIGGSPLTTLAAATGTVTIPGASALLAANANYAQQAGGVLVVSPAFAGGPGAGFMASAYLDSSTTDLVHVQVINVTTGTLTPTAGPYMVAVLQIPS